MANPTASVGNEESAVFEEVRRYLRIRQLDLKGIYAANDTQPMVIDLENDSSVVHKPFATTGPRETTWKGRAATTHEVRAHATTCISDTYRFHQVPGDIQPVSTVLRNRQDARMDSTPSPAKIAVNALGLIGTAMIRVDAINTGYRQTLSTFSTIVNGITRVCHVNSKRSSLTDDHA